MGLKYLKTDAIVKIDFGSGFVQRLQQIVFFILKDKSPEKIEEFKKLLPEQTKEYINFPEDWMNHIFTLSILLKEIEEEADKQGMSYESKDDSSTEEEN